MSKINTNVSSLIAQRILGRNNNQLSQSLERLSTGLQINRGADNPSGLIASENLRAEKAGITQALSNAERANNIIGTAEGGLGEVSALLIELQSLVSEAANDGGMSSEEIAANQIQVDAILNTINRLAQSTSFQGRKLLDGSLAYQTSGLNGEDLTNLQINAARIPDGEAMEVEVELVTAAAEAEGTGTGATLGDGETVTIEVTGNLGTASLVFDNEESVEAMAAALNALSAQTGVAVDDDGNDFVFTSLEKGANQFVQATATGQFTFSVDESGTDAAVTVNGQSAQLDGLNVTYRDGNLDVSFTMTEAFNDEPGTSTFDITGGGATFALGAKVTETDKASIGIGSVSTAMLGNDTLGFLSSLSSGGSHDLNNGNLVNAQKIVDESIRQVAQLRGRLGAFQRFTVGSTVNSLGVAFENASAAESAIRDTDFAQETANLTRSQILTQAATTVLAQANASPQQALLLLQ